MPVRVFDFFSGCGGTSIGLQAAGMHIAFANDNDADCAQTFRFNIPDARFLPDNVRDIDVNTIADLARRAPNDALLFCGCAPCQPFSRQNRHRTDDDGRRGLLNEFGRFVEHYVPDLIFVENVPGWRNATVRTEPFTALLELLQHLDYAVQVNRVFAQDYGVPQRRQRLILLASRLGPPEFPHPTYGPQTPNANFATVRQYIGHLPAIAAGETHPTIPNHRAANLSPLNLQRIMAVGDGGGRMDWPDHLVLDCHRGDFEGHTDVYGRMHWDQPAPGLTTRCISLSNGRFGHPEQHRAISVREAACLQTFPQTFVFHGNLGSMARQIGNAVPVLMAQRFGEALMRHVHAHRPEVLANGDL